MGARTQVSLCPPGRPRRSLVGKLQTRRSRRTQMQQTGGNNIVSGAGSLRPPRPLSRNQSGRSEENLNPQLDRVFDQYDREEESYLADPDLGDR
eukprot:6631609-Ditylum_brightwellii.AAC.1